DTVKITKQPHNTMGSISAKAVFAVDVENAGIPQASSISAFAFTWQYKIHNQGAWLDLPQKIQDTCVNTSSKNQTHTSTLSLPYAFFAGSNGEDTLNRYRCLITPKTPVCSEDQQISEEVKASKVPPFYAGVLHTLMGTDPGRLYYTDSMATFFVKDYTGNKVSFDWFIYNGTTETPLTQANFPEFIKLSPKQDTLYLTAAKKLFNGSNILRVYVQDDVPYETRMYLERILKTQEAPTFAFTSATPDTICENTAKSYTVNPSPATGHTYAWAWFVQKKGEPNFTEIVAGSGSGAPCYKNESAFYITQTSLDYDSAWIKVEIREDNCYPGILKTFTHLLRVEAPLSLDPLVGDTLCEGLSKDLIAHHSRSLSPISSTWFKETSLNQWEEPLNAQRLGDTLRFKVLIKADSAHYKFKAKNRCNSTELASNVVTIAVKALPDVQVKPLPILANPSLCNGGNTTIELRVSGDDVTYQWKHKGADLVASTDILNVTSATLSLQNLRLSQSGPYSVQLGGNKACASIINANPDKYLSQEVTLRVDTLPLYTPLLAQTGVVYKQVTFAATITNAEVDAPTAPTPTYQWYIQRPSDATFVKIADLITATPAYADTFVNYTTQNLQIKNLPLLYNQSRVKCELSNICGSTFTNEGLLTVLNKLEIVKPWAQNASTCLATDTALIIHVNLDPLDIQWQYRTSSTAPWLPITATQTELYAHYDTAYTPLSNTVILKIKKVEAAQNGYEYRCLMNQQEPEADRITSSVLQLQVKMPALFQNKQITSSNAVVVISNNETTNLTGPALKEGYGIPTPSYSWQEQYRYVDLDFKPISGATNTSYLSTPTDTGTYQYRYIASNTCGSDTAITSVLAIKKLRTETMLFASFTPENNRKDTLLNGKQGENIRFEECESNSLRLFSPKNDAQALANKMYWQYTSPDAPSTWNTIDADMEPFFLDKDTLIIKPITIKYSGYQFRHIKTAAVERASDTSAILCFVVSADTSLKPTLQDFPPMLLVNQDLVLKAHLGTAVENAT
ncbi:MAG: immunoglobulin domain-containing protein, partial [Bacteroidales bacterium]